MDVKVLSLVQSSPYMLKNDLDVSDREQIAVLAKN